MQNTKIYKLEGIIQHYDWGGTEFLADLLQVDNQKKMLFAEYWMGAHENAPSEIVLPKNKRRELHEFIQSNPAETLGEYVQQSFGRLPYLLKVLDVKNMLSIQVHPAKKAAEKEFDAESLTGITPDDPNRNYKDNNHKPELLVALSEFWLLHGFKPKKELTQILEATEDLNFLLPFFLQGGYEGLYKYVMEMSQAEVNDALQPLLSKICPQYEQGLLKKTDENFWAARAAQTFNQPEKIDRGIFSIYLFNLVRLEPGEAVFQDAGIPHAYLEGQNVEIMANSDNVLRGGLTSKRIDVTELLKHVKFEPIVPHIIKPRISNDKQEIFETPAKDFQLNRIQLKESEQLTVQSQTAEIYLVYEGHVEAVSEEEILKLSRGEAMFVVTDATVSFTCKQDATLFRATVPKA